MCTGKGRRHRQRGRLHQPVVAVAVAEAHVVADAQVVEARRLRPRATYVASSLGALFERAERWADADAHPDASCDVHARGSFGRPSTRSATMLRWISLAPP